MKRYAKALGKYRCRRSSSMPSKVLARLVRRFAQIAIERALETLGGTMRSRMLACGVGPAARPGKFKVGDVVTRAGDDLQRVTEIDEEGFCLTVECIRAPESGWCQVGDVERNLVRRYELAARRITRIQRAASAVEMARLAFGDLAVATDQATLAFEELREHLEPERTEDAAIAASALLAHVKRS